MNPFTIPFSAPFSTPSAALVASPGAGPSRAPFTPGAGDGIDWTWDDCAEPAAQGLAEDLADDGVDSTEDVVEPDSSGARPLNQEARDHFIRLLEHCLEARLALRSNAELVQVLRRMRFAGEPTLAQFIAQAERLVREARTRSQNASPAADSTAAASLQWEGVLRSVLAGLSLREQLFAKGVAWYDWESWERCYSLCSGTNSDTDREWRRGLERMRSRGPFATFGHMPAPSEVLALQAHHPNFAEPLQYIAQQLALCRRRGEPHCHLPPLLLSGPAGVGKTHFAQSLAKVFSTPCRRLDFASLSAGFSLAGLDRRWSSGAIGQVVSALLESDNIDPLFFLDEIDKAGTDAKSSPLGPLYALLERESARKFRDEYLDMAVDASHILWLAACNHVEPIPGPLLSRFQCFVIPSPTPLQMRQIAHSIFQNMVQGMRVLQPEMPAHWMERLQHSSVRVAQRALAQALGRSALRADVEGQAVLELRSDDMPELESSRPRRAAFY